MPSGKPVLAAAVLCAALPCATASGQTADAIVAEFNARYQLAVSQADPEKLMALYDGEVYLVDENTANMMPTGRAELEETVRGFFKGFKSVSLTLRPRRSAFLTPDVILSQQTWDASGVMADGQAMSPRSGLCLLVLVKRPGGWKEAGLGSFVPGALPR